MVQINRFSLRVPSGERDSWPKRVQLVVDGKPTSLTVSGYALLYQFETSCGFVLVTDFDCPYEEAVCFTLIDKSLGKVESERCVGSPYCSYWLERFVWRDDHRFDAYFRNEPDRWEFSIRRWGIPLVRQKLTMARVKSSTNKEPT